ncbi:MAG: pimeloyl-ACP methyl ester esterase BioH [Thermomonas sp.]
MHVDVIGRGPPLVLLHGWAMHGGVFAPLVERLQATRTLHVVDLPGHGGSRTCDVALTLEAATCAIFDVVPAKAPWCGWSLGGLIAMHAATTQPQRVSALVMLCATPKFVRSDDWPQGMPVEVFRSFADGLRDDWRGTLERFIALEAFGSDHARDELRMLQQDLFARGEPAPQVLADGLALLESCDLRASLQALEVPSLWLAGRRDRLVDPRAMQQASRITTNARHAQVEHAGHAPFLTHAGVVAKHLLDFLPEVEGAGA